MTRTPGERTRPDDRTAQHPGQLRRPHPAVDQSARQITEGLAGTAGLSDPVLPQAVLSLQGLPHPGALSAAQLNLIASSVAAQRQSIAAMQAQLRAFDALAMNTRREAGPEG